MKNTVFLVFFCFSLFQVQCSKPAKEADGSIFPLKISTWAQFRCLGITDLDPPNVNFFITEDSIEITVGATEKYYISYAKSGLGSDFLLLDVEDLMENQRFYHPGMRCMGLMRFYKEIDGIAYTKEYASYRRREEVLENVFPTEGKIVASIAEKLINISLQILTDEVDKDTMITAWSMSEALEDPARVYKLSLRNRKTSVLSPKIRQLVNLRVLDISGSRITALPPEIEHCTQLHTILANASPLATIPPSIGKLRKLRNLNFGYCKIKILPEEMGELVGLWSLSLGSNQLNDLPASFSNLKNLEFFSIAGNQFSIFPEEALEMITAHNLWIHGNNITWIPPEITRMKNLGRLLVDKSEIENVAEIEQLIPGVMIIDENR